VTGGIRTGNPRKQEAVDVRPTRRGHWDRQRELYSTVTITCSHSSCAYFEDIIVFHAESHSRSEHTCFVLLRPSLIHVDSANLLI
jgi:hypothetical protein